MTFEDSRGKDFRLEYTLDWGFNRDRLSVRTYTVHDGVKALQDISRKLGTCGRRVIEMQGNASTLLVTTFIARPSHLAQ